MAFANFLSYGALFSLPTASLYKFMTAKVFDEFDSISEPPDTSIIMCTLNEEEFIEDALESLKKQNVCQAYPDKFEFIVVDSNSEDKTVEIAKKYADQIFQASRGKLNARHLGIEKAEGQVIVGVDADCRYPPNYLNLVLRHFQCPNVVGVIAPRLVDPREGVFYTGLSVWFSLFDVGPLLALGMRAPGQSTSFRRAAYYQIGGFNLDINQLDMHEMVREEEIRFAWKLRQLGSVIVDFQAPMFTSLRRAGMLRREKRYKQYVQQRFSGKRF